MESCTILIGLVFDDPGESIFLDIGLYFGVFGDFRSFVSVGSNISISTSLGFFYSF